MNQSECEANPCNRCQARENAGEQARMVLVLFPTEIGRESGGNFTNQS